MKRQFCSSSSQAASKRESVPVCPRVKKLTVIKSMFRAWYWSVRIVSSSKQPHEWWMLGLSGVNSGSYTWLISARPHEHWLKSLNWTLQLCLCCWSLLELLQWNYLTNNMVCCVLLTIQLNSEIRAVAKSSFFQLRQLAKTKPTVSRLILKPL